MAMGMEINFYLVLTFISQQHSEHDGPGDPVPHPPPPPNGLKDTELLTFCNPGSRSHFWVSVELAMFFVGLGNVLGKMVVPLGWYPSCFNTLRSPFNGDIPYTQ